MSAEISRLCAHTDSNYGTWHLEFRDKFIIFVGVKGIDNNNTLNTKYKID